MMARLSINGSRRTAAAATRGSQDTGMLARLRVPLLADIPDGNRGDGLPPICPAAASALKSPIDALERAE